VKKGMVVSSSGGVNDVAVSEESTAATTQQENEAKTEKIKVHLVAVGSAPILKKSKFLMNSDDRFVVAITFLRKILKLSPSNSSLFLYVNAAFVPSPEERIGDLFDCFGSRGELVIHYCMQEAWG
jgi:ubiquitin-like protein ATG12